ncbi:hypothetical protein RHODO2019_18160 (plasmid) [Rhodococcus antarcticus]|jgi:hypothetical protein|uniref:Secreted protein n=1 Tax=Rhodococcus antarcticus TaxID=2987751 RepID=A0ABY6P730_9NOCA|nr:hypothetical protein [Rhodococcus antarcticus]UZJ26918.1 hypothetical protein RHODO2019_18160 [Rhodococcus antarcticus]
MLIAVVVLLVQWSHHDGHGPVLEGQLASATDLGLHRVHNLEPHLPRRRTHLSELRGDI